MIFEATPLEGVYVIHPEPQRDYRGSFTRVFCANEFEAHGLCGHIVQCSVSYNHKRATLRGMHYQEHPFGEAKLVRCTAGEVFDVVVDLRSDSASLGRWFGVALTARDRKAVYVPEGCAHGFITLVDGTELFYQISTLHSPEHSRGFRWDDPIVRIAWPVEPEVVSSRDQQWGALEL
jgi:dTDP-4-dehydrorhamnose 3,5-epimerase